MYERALARTASVPPRTSAILCHCCEAATQSGCRVVTSGSDGVGAAPPEDEARNVIAIDVCSSDLGLRRLGGVKRRSCSFCQLPRLIHTNRANPALFCNIPVLS